MSTTEEFNIQKLMDNRIMYLSEGQQFVCNKLPADIQVEDLSLFRVSEICAEDEIPRREALENVLSSLRINGVNFLFLIIGNDHGVSFYYGLSRDLTSSTEMISDIHDIGEHVLQKSLKGNFRGSRLTKLNNEEKIQLISVIQNMKYQGCLEGVPGTSKENEKFQGADRLVDVMLGDEFAFMVVAKPLNFSQILDIQSDIYDLYSKIVPLSKSTIQTGTTTNKGKTVSEGESTSKSTSTSSSSSDTDGPSNSYNSKNANYSHTSGTTNGSTDTTSTSIQNSTTTGSGTSDSTSHEYVNKEAQDWIKYLDEIILPRLDYGKGKGIFVSMIALFSTNPTHLQKLQNTATALFAGNSGNRVPLRVVSTSKEVSTAIRNFQLPTGSLNVTDDEAILSHKAMSQVINKRNNTAYLGNWINTNELSIISGLPKKEVLGLALRNEVEFGLNPDRIRSEDDTIALGKLVQNGIELNNTVYLDKKILDQHIFIAGVTGSGKTTTCQNILGAADTPFIVIEPAKTEYRILKEKYPDLIVFTLGKNDVAPFRINPFRFFSHENITSRVDMIKACIEAAFDMEAAIPQIIEAAIYKSYEQKGWNISANTNTFFDDPFDHCSDAFPTISDVINNTTVVVKEQGFDERLMNDYIGSIKARLQGLTIGSKGHMLNTAHSVDFEELLNHKVVLELEEIRSGSEKSLIMGFVFIELIEAIKAKYLKEGKIKHITLVEEAHRLLAKYQPGDDPNKRHGVEMFADMLAEIRKYGESLVIVDQIPNKLTNEVLKNTNTKIIHKIFAEDDKDAIGNTVMLDKKQKEYLSDLKTGRAIFFSSNTRKAVQVQMLQSFDTARKAPSDYELTDNAMEYYARTYKNGALCGSELFPDTPDTAQLSAMHKLSSAQYVHDFFDGIFKRHSLSARLKAIICECADTIGHDVFMKYIKKYVANDFLLGEANDERFNVIISEVLSDRELSIYELGEISEYMQRKYYKS